MCAFSEYKKDGFVSQLESARRKRQGALVRGGNTHGSTAAFQEMWSDKHERRDKRKWDLTCDDRRESGKLGSSCGFDALGDPQTASFVNALALSDADDGTSMSQSEMGRPPSEV
jgi:hypothetical protein